MAVEQITEEALRENLSEHSKIITFYRRHGCTRCEELYPAFIEMSEKKSYKNIDFFILNAEEDTTANKLIATEKIPFISAYHDGLLIECRTVQNTKELKYVIDQLTSQV